MLSFTSNLLLFGSVLLCCTLIICMEAGEPVRQSVWLCNQIARVPVVSECNTILISIFPIQWDVCIYYFACASKAWKTNLTIYWVKKSTPCRINFWAEINFSFIYSVSLCLYLVFAAVVASLSQREMTVVLVACSLTLIAVLVALFAISRRWRDPDKGLLSDSVHLMENGHRGNNGQILDHIKLSAVVGS